MSSAAPPIGVLALQGDVGQHVAALAACGADARLVRRPEELIGLAGLVLPGGESTTIDRLAGAFGLREPLRQALRAGLPAYGSCAGMILLADRILDPVAGQHTFGGLDVTVRRNAFGRQTDSFETGLTLDGLGLVHGVFIRAPWVEEAGPHVRVWGRVLPPGRDTSVIVAVAQAQILATAFHPEITGDIRVHQRFVDLVRRA